MTPMAYMGKARVVICAMIAGGLALPAAAQDGCGLVPAAVARAADPFSAYIPSVENAQSLPKEGVFSLHLRPVDEVIYPVAPQRASDGGNGGIITLENIPAGRYRIVLSEMAWIDVVQERRRLPILSAERAVNCPGTRSSVQVEVRGEPLTLQIGGVAARRINVAVLRIWPFEWTW